MAPGALFLALAGAAGALGVALGAFGAHGLKTRLGSAGQDVWETAVFYHLIHAVAVVAVAGWLRWGGASAAAAVNVAGWSFLLGILLFSGSLYLLALGGPRFLGPITPIGGVAFIVGWLSLLWAAVGSGDPP